MSAKELRNTDRSRTDRPSRHAGQERSLHDPSDPPAVARRFADAIVPRLTDFVAVHLFDEVVRGTVPSAPLRDRSPLRRVVSVDAKTPGRFGALLPPGQIVRWAPDSPMLTSLARGETAYIPHFDDTTADQFAAGLEAPGLAEALRHRSVLMLPLVSKAVLIGNALLIGEPGRPVHHEPEMMMFEELARWTAESIEQALRHRRERRVIDQLVWMARPAVPERLAGIELGYRYLPHGGRTERLGGDWFDAIPLPAGRTALVVGDVAGHGMEAAIKMSQCKTMVRTLASLDLPPDQLLHRFHLLIRRLHKEYGDYDDFLATCVYAVYDPQTRECHVANAGQVPPVLVHPDGQSELLDGFTGTPIGVAGGGFESCTFSAADGSLLAFYTDGLVETKKRDIGDGIQAVVARLTAPQQDLERTCDEVLARLAACDRDDDLTLLLARLTGPRPATPVTRAPGPTTGPVSGPVPRPRLETSDREEGPGGQEAAATFIGRGRELDEIRRLLGSARLVTLTGAAGVGKSRLARQAAEQIAAEFPDGIRLVDLSAVRDPIGLPQAVAEVLALTECPNGSWEDTVARALADKRMLLLLDTCEHLVPACAEFVRGLLRTAPGIRILATGRQPLRTPGEHRIMVAPLSLDDAVTMFTASARRHLRPAADTEAVRTLCRRLEGIPLSIELAAGLLQMLSLDSMVARLDHRLDLLMADSCPPAARHQSLRAAIGWSHELCEPSERLLWTRLSVFAGGFDLAAAEYVCSDAELPHAEILELMARLVRKSIAIPEKSTATPHFVMLDTLREYGREHLAWLGDPRPLQRRHRDWYRHTVLDIAAQWSTSDQADCCDRMHRDHRNIRTALDFSLGYEDDAQTGLSMAAAIWPLWIVGGFLAEGRELLNHFLSLVHTPNPLRVKALWIQGWLAGLQGDRPSSLNALRECRALAERLSDESATVFALRLTAEVALRDDDGPAAIRLYEEAMARYRAAGDESGAVACLPHLALCRALTDSADPQVLQQAISQCEEALDHVIPAEALWHRSSLMHAHALSLWQLGQHQAAERVALESLRLQQRLHDRPGMGTTLELLAWLCAATGRHQGAAILTGAAARIWRETGTCLMGLPQLRRWHDLTQDDIRAALGPEPAERLSRQGNDLFDQDGITMTTAGGELTMEVVLDGNGEP